MDPGAPSSIDNQGQDQGHNRQESGEGFIPFEHSEPEPESDVEIDLITQPPKKAVPKVPKQFRKSNAQVYDNISVYAPPDSNLIFRCSRKRANWYLSRSLARSLSPNSIHLTFEPAGQGHVNDPYHLEERENKCVICGQLTADAGATLLHVVPEQYRKWFPLRIKSHSSFDILVACPECNAQWDREAAVVRKTIVDLYDVPLEGVGWVKDYEAGVAKRAAGAVVADWKRRWQEYYDHRESLKVALSSTAEDDSEFAPADGGNHGKKKKKSKVQNVIPAERIQILEKSVLDWWNKRHMDSESSLSEPSQQKRELSQDLYVSTESTQKKLKADDGSAVQGRSTAPTSAETESATVNERKKNESAPGIEVPEAPPGHSTLLNQTMLRSALDAQASYKGPGYKEHGQLVVAKVMASSPSYHDDPQESAETIRSWKEGEPLISAPVGWKDVVEFHRRPFHPSRVHSEMRFLDLNRYSLISFTASLIAIAYSSHKSLFDTPSSFLNLGLLKSLEPFLKDVMPFGESSFSSSSFDAVWNDLLLLHTSSSSSYSPQNTQHIQQQKQDKDQDSRDQHNNEDPSSKVRMSPGRIDSHEHSRLLGGAAGVGNGFQPSVFQAMLAERYLKFRTPSPAVLLQLQVILSYLQNEKLCVLVFTNMAFCMAFLAGRLFLRTFFGDLRVIERQHMYDRALNFLLFKVVFVGAILEPRWEELLIWTAWFTILGFLRVFSMLCRDRFEYLTVSPSIPIRVHVKILTMLSLILVSNIAWFVLCISVFRSMLLLLSFECFTLFLDTIQTLVKYIIHLGDLSRQGPCESRRAVQYYTEFVTDTMILVTTLGHYLHIMYLHGISFTLIDAVLFLNMRSVFNNLRKKLSSHQAYRQALCNMQALYPSATESELADYSDDCAICRDSMTSAKVLPCGHIFHLFCIRSWLEHHSSCPTCRRSLVSQSGSNDGTDESRGSSQEDVTLGILPTGLLASDSHTASRRGSWAATPSSQPTMSSSSTSNTSSHILALSGHPTSNTIASGSSHMPPSSGTSSNRSSTGHQLFAFNSEQQPWLSRLGFPRITVEVVDPAQDDDEEAAHIRRAQQHQQQHHAQDRGRSHFYQHSNRSISPARRYRNEDEVTDDEEDEDLRRAIAESLAMSQLSQSYSATSLPPSSNIGTTTTSAAFEPGLRPARSSTVSLPSLSGTTRFRGACQTRRGSIEGLPLSCLDYDGPSTVQRDLVQDGRVPGCDLRID
ncbi:hypothetical protein BGX28_002899 [Mortierella sp. GBA30]|nr:hypothetical protein BGX28_002899 [Mortierella sp. GBA30]